MNALFVALGIVVLALLALLLWFVPHLLQQQAARVASETSQLREMLLDLLNEQEAVTFRQTQLSSSLSSLQGQIESLSRTDKNNGWHSRQAMAFAETGMHQLETRLTEIQAHIQLLGTNHQQRISANSTQDNESWANLIGLLATIQERIGMLSHDRSSALAGLQAGALLEELEQEMHNLRSISEEIAMLQWRLRRSLLERETNLSVLRSHTSNGVS